MNVGVRPAAVAFAPAVASECRAVVLVSMPGCHAKEVEERATRPMGKLLWEIPDVEYTALAVVAGATVILADPIFQGVAIALMAGSLISMFTAPVLVRCFTSWRTTGS